MKLAAAALFMTVALAVPADATVRAFTIVGTLNFSQDATATPRVHFDGTLSSPSPSCLPHRQIALGWFKNRVFHLVGVVFSNDNGTFKMDTDGAVYRKYGYKITPVRRGNVECGGSVEKFV